MYYEQEAASEEVVSIWLEALAQTLARCEDTAREGLLRSLQVDLASMQPLSDDSRIRLEGLHRALTIRVNQQVSRHPR